MVKNRFRIVAWLTYSVDLFLAVVSFYFAYWIRDVWIFSSFDRLVSLSSYQWFLFFILPFWSLAFYYGGAYEFSYTSSPFKGILRLWAAIALGVVSLAAVIFIFKSLYFSRLFIITFGATNIVLAAAGRFFVWFVTRRYRQFPANVVIAGDGQSAARLAGIIENHRNWGLNLLGFVSEEPARPVQSDGPGDSPSRRPVLGSIKDMPELIDRHIIDEVIFAVSQDRLSGLEDTMLLLEDEGIKTRIVLDIFPHMIARIHIDEIDNVPLLTFTTIPTDEFALFMKRVLDVAISSSALAALSPVFALLAFFIKTTSRGPVLFVQQRSGLNGRIFDFYKFRSMQHDAEKKKSALLTSNEMDGPAFKMRRDPRITAVGRIIRKTSMDELPQLWNVLKGDMSIVGPRPPLPSEVAKYERWQKRKLSMKPGITCIWQVSGRNLIRFQDWIKLDLEYIDNWSLWLDVKILFKTIPAIITGRGAY